MSEASMPEPRTKARINPRSSAIAIAAVVATGAAPIIAGHEGLLTTARPDLLTVQHVITYCYGDTDRTGAVKAGDKFTPAYCKSRLSRRVLEFAVALAPCITADISVASFIAIVDFGYNLGVAATCRSTLLKKYNAGDEAGAAAEILRWTWSGGKDCRVAKKPNGQWVCHGIVDRREAEHALFVEGLR